MNLIQLSALFAGLAVVLGAFGAHALKASLDAHHLAIYNTAVFYHLVHSLAALMAMLMAHGFSQAKFKRATVAFLIGVVLFSGSLYLLAITGVKWLGAITPFGGLSFIIAWVLIVLYAKGTSDGH